MEPATEQSGVVKYQFQADDDEWANWKDTVPRRKSLEKRINELIVADTEGRVFEDACVDEACRDLERALENHDWAAVEDAAARLGCDTDHDTG